MKRKWLAYVLAGTMTLTNITPMAMPAAAAEVSVEDTVVADEETPLLDEEVLEAADEAADEDFTAALPEAEDGEAELIDEEQLFVDEDLQDGLEAVFEEDQIAEPETDWSFTEEVVTDDEEEAADEQVVAEGGLELGDFTREFHVNPGDSVTLSLPNVTSDNDITYRWYEYDPAYEVIDGAVSSSFTVDNVQKKMEFECLVMSGDDSTWAHFYIYIDNDLSVQRVGGYDRYVDYGSDVTLKVKAESKYDNLTYRWYDSTEGVTLLEGTDCSEYTLSGVEKTHYIYCYVSDPYGNSSYTSFDVYVENELTVSAASGITSIHVPYGESVDLEVNASCREGDLTYRWYNSSTGKDIEDTAGSSCHIPEVTKQHDITCNVTDQYGNIRSVTFYVYVENELQVSAASDTSFKVPYGESVDLKVSASCRDGELSYEWYDNTSYNTITGAEGSSYTLTDVTTRKSIICTVSDQYGNEASVYFYVNIDNELKVSAISDTSLYIPYGESTTLEVTASCKDNQLTYEWYDSTRSTKKIEGAAGSTCTVPEVTKKQYIYCRVSDQYGNEQSVSFYIYVDNELEVTALTDNTLYIPYGESTTLEVSASCRDNQLTYEWYDNTGYTKQIEGVEGSAYTIPEVTKKQNIYCRVSDQYGNEQSVSFYIYVDNEFKVSAASDTYLRIPYGESTTLEVSASCKDNQLTYEWFDNTGATKKIEGAAGSTYTISEVTKKQNIYCRVSDLYGNQDTVYFYIYVDNQLTASAAERVQKIPYGEAVTLTVNASCASGPLTYVWYETTSDDKKLEGYTDSFYTLSSVTEKHEYTCYVYDQYGNSSDVDFTVYVDSGFSVEDYESNVSVAPEQSITLQAPTASSIIGTISYQWYGPVYDENGYYRTEPVSGATDKSFVTDKITKYTSSYYCRITDGYQSYDASFNISIDNALSAANGSDANVRVPYGESTTLVVDASCNSGELTFTWQRSWNEIKGESGNALTLENVKEADDYECVVNDQYGNRKTVYFSVYVDSGFALDDDSSRYYRIAPEESLTLQAPAVKTNVPGAVISYQWRERVYNKEYGWYSYEDIEGATAASYETGSIARSTDYYCRISDGVESGSVHYSITIDNELRISDEETSFDVKYGEDITLEVQASCASGALTYSWYITQYDEDGYSKETLIEGAEGSTYKVTNITRATRLRCLVGDEYGNAENVYFYIYIDNQLSIKYPSGLSTTVAPHGEVTLTFEATCLTGSDQLTYQWYDESTDEEIEGETTNTLVLKDITKSGGYFCQVTDVFENTKTADFYVKVDTGLSVTKMMDGVENDNFYVPTGSDVTLSVKATSNSDQPITYSWYLEDEEDELLLAEGVDSWELKNVTENTEVFCRVSDGYQSMKSWFSVYPFTGLHISGAYVEAYYGESAVLSVQAQTTRNTALTYQWYIGHIQSRDSDGEPNYTYELLPGETRSSLSIASVTKYMRYRCAVSDGTDQKAGVFHVSVRDGFSAYAAESDMVKQEADGSAILSVETEIYRQNVTLSYNWYALSDTDQLTLLSDSHSAELKLQNASSFSRYRCTVSDQYGEEHDVDFTVYPGDLFTESREEAAAQGKDLVLGTTVTVPAINGVSNYYRFIPTESGSYRIRLTSPSDKYISARLYEAPYDGDDINDYLTSVADIGSAEMLYQLNAGEDYYVYTTSDDNKLTEVTITVVKDSGLSASAVLPAQQAKADGTAVLTVNAESDETIGGEKHYTWYHLTNGSWEKMSQTTSEIKVSGIHSIEQYYCIVSDQSSEVRVNFSVYTAQDVHTSPATAVTVSGEKMAGILLPGNNNVYFRFVPTESKAYTFYSESDADLYGYLYDAKEIELKHNDDGGSEGNFKFTYSMTAGETYYIRVREYNGDYDTPIAFQLCMSDTEQPDGPTTHTHTIVNDPAVAATCTAAGKTAGRHCSVCGTVIQAQTAIPATGHKWSAWQDVSEATVLEAAKHTRKCSVCGAVETVSYGNKLPATGKLNATSFPLKLKQKTTKLVVTDMAKGDYVKSWVSSDTKKVTVSGKANGTCTVTANKKKTGSAKITVTLASGKVLTATVKVQKAKVKTKSVKSNVAKKLTLKKGASVTANALINPISSSDKVKFKTSNKKIVTVTSKGVIKAKKAGKAKITITSGKKKYVINVTVQK